MIFDAFPLTYEVDALAVRLAELAPLAAVHVIVEGSTTLRHVERTPLWPSLVDDPRFAPHGRRVHHEVLDIPDGLSPMGAEVWLRNRLPEAAARAGAMGYDSVIVADADEVPAVDQVETAVAAGEMLWLHTDYRELRIDWRAPDGWQLYHQAYIAPLRQIVGGNHHRQDERPPHGIGGGWHLSSMGGPAAVAAKLGSYSHPEADPHGTFGAAEWVSWCAEVGRDVLDRFDLQPVAHEPGLLPLCVLADPDAYGHLLRETAHA